jgi:transcriptional regulator of acetoin/glycerol metabolism
MSDQNLDMTDPMKAAWEEFILRDVASNSILRKEVLESWKRCKRIGLDPLSKREKVALSSLELMSFLLNNKELIEAAEPIMNVLEISVRGTGFITTLSDRNGYVLKVCGDQEIMEMAEQNYYLPGCSRSEQDAGTNAIGLCLQEKKPIQLTGAEHYNINHHPWTCSSAPIFNSNRDLMGAITLSGKSIGKHQHTLALVISAAEAVESKLRERTLINDEEKLNILLNSIVNSISDAIITIDNELVISHINNYAKKLFCIGVGDVVGKEIQKAVKPDNFLVRSIRNQKYFANREVTFFSSKKPLNCICSISPIRNSQSEILGTIITFNEKKKVITIAQKIGGNYAKYQFEDIKGNSHPMVRQIELAKIAAKTNSRILIVGESGTGKELFSQSIHNYSSRRNGPFVAISCAAIPRDLIEAELFGYREGAFTGARKEGQIGRFELADKGTLFLDDIDGLPLDLQSKILRVLEQNEIVRLGDARPILVDVRVIAASNKDLLKEVENRNFREDLYYRLNVVEIFIPPLRERMEDLHILIESMLKRYCHELGIERLEMSKEVMNILKSYHWPGNVRELENVIERAILLSKGKMIRKEQIPQRLLAKSHLSLRKVRNLKEGTVEMIRTALRECEGNKALAGRSLKISRSTLYRKMREFELTAQAM